MYREKGVLREKKGALASENDNDFGTKFESYNINYFRTKEVHLHG
jgi:hypothetical protein